jgi:hypothetical protein
MTSKNSPEASSPPESDEDGNTPYRGKIIHRNLDGSYSIDDAAQHYPTLAAAKQALDAALR